MDQGNHDEHHQSKTSRAQVKLQLSNKGCRDAEELVQLKKVELPGRVATKSQEQRAFARKSYRFFDGGKICKANILKLLQSRTTPREKSPINALLFDDFGAILRNFGQFHSAQRLLPKYAYASPGALYATQLYLEIRGIEWLADGIYYYHPVSHQLFKLKELSSVNNDERKDAFLLIHFVGKKSGIEPIYKNNILEVLEIESGHMIALFEEVLSEYGLNISQMKYPAAPKDVTDICAEDFYLGSCEILAAPEHHVDSYSEIYVQIHPQLCNDIEHGLYRYHDGELHFINDEVVQRKHVIAINQHVYERATFGLTIVSKDRSYVDLGRALQRLQMNDLNIGLMSAGYSSKTGNDLPAARRIKELVGADIDCSYFCIGGRISDEQRLSRDMNEDKVHMKGPAEMIRDDLANFLPSYMLPNKVVVLNKMPLSANGKIDYQQLKTRKEEIVQKNYVAPRNNLERQIHEIWCVQLRRDNISIDDNFFELGGNSLIAVCLITQINRHLGYAVPLQTLFEYPTIESLTAHMQASQTASSSRLISLKKGGFHKAIFAWPGLGGFCMNLGLLAKKMAATRPFFGIQAHGVNEGEQPYAAISEMALQDIKLIKKIQPQGPYTLWGYSFGAKVAFETAYQLECAGDIVENLFLIAPGSPKLNGYKHFEDDHVAIYGSKLYVAILFSVFMRGLPTKELNECLRVSVDEHSFIDYILRLNKEMDSPFIKRIIVSVHGLSLNFRGN